MALVTKYVDPTDTTLEGDDILLWSELLGRPSNVPAITMDNDNKFEAWNEVGAALDFIRENGGVVAFGDGIGIGFYTIQEE
ncbi:hypothetical protein RCDURKIN_132 [Rhodobacter phage RcDurkin]|nr:hypothetical protein RCDURKIN_132 [Rhodobacter phage RcDurkin]